MAFAVCDFDFTLAFTTGVDAFLRFAAFEYARVYLEST